MSENRILTRITDEESMCAVPAPREADCGGEGKATVRS